MLSARPFPTVTLYPQKKKITGSSQMFPVVISSMEDFSDDEGL